MADTFTKDEFFNSLDVMPSQPAAAGIQESMAQASDSLLPKSSAAIFNVQTLPTATSSPRFRGHQTSEQREKEFYATEKRDDVPLEMRSDAIGSVSPWMRFQTERRENTKDQIAYLESKLGPGKARLSKDGKEIIATIPDDANPGKEKDVLLDEKNMTLGDFAALGKHVPGAAGAILAMAATGGSSTLASAPGWIRGLVTILSGSAGQKVGEGLSEAETRLEEGKPMEIGELAKRKVMEIPGQAALDVGTLGMMKGVSLVQRAARGGMGYWETPVQAAGKKAAAELEVKYGTGLSYSAGEASGSPLTIFFEEYAKAKPQARAVWEELKTVQEREKQAIGKAMTAYAGTDEAVGRDLLSVLEVTKARKDSALNAMRETMTASESTALDKLLKKSVPVATDFKPSVAGQSFRDDFQSLFADVKTKVGKAYEDAYASPGAKVANIDTAPLKGVLSRIEKQTQGIQGLGQVLSMAGELRDSVPYQYLVQLRSQLWQRIEEAPADRSVKDFYGTKISSAITELMEDAAKKMPTSDFKNKIQAANSLFKKSELPFRQQDIGDLLMKSGVPGSPDNIEILQRFSSNTDLYKRLVELTGAKSKPVETIKQSVVDGLLSKSGTQALGAKYIDGAQFFNNLQALKTNPKTREMFDDIFGNNGDELLKQSKMLGAIQGTLPKDEVLKLLTDVGMAAKKIRSLKVLNDTEAAISREYTTDLMKSVKTGTFNASTVNPEDLINRFLDWGTESEVKSVKAAILKEDPSLMPMLQDKLTEKILGKAGTYETWNRSKLEAIIHDPDMVGKYRAIMGSKFKDLDNFSKALGPIQLSEEIGGQTGMLVKGQTIGKLADVFDPSKTTKFVAGTMKEVPSWLGWKTASWAITRSPVRKWAGKTWPKEIPRLAEAAVLSEPFLEEMATSDHSPEVVKSVVGGVRAYLKRVGLKKDQLNAPRVMPAPAGTLSRDEFMKSLDRR